MNDRDPDQDIIDEIDRQIAEGKDLDDLTPVRARPARNPRAVVSVRVSPETFDVVYRAAASRGVSVSEFFRDAAIAEAKLELASKQADGMTLAEMARELDRLRAKVDVALKQSARGNVKK